MTIGEQIQTLRIQRGLTQEQLAEMLEVSRQSISKWELGQTVPDVDKIIRISELFDISTDTILLRNTQKELDNKNSLHLGSIYLIVKDFEKSVKFYETLFNTKVGDRCRTGNKFVEFYIDNKCLSLMNEDNVIGHCTDLNSPYKFVQNYWVEDLVTEHNRIKSLHIGKVTEHLEAHPAYHYFHLTDPDNNIIEITGTYHKKEYICQSCGMQMGNNVFGKNSDGTTNKDFCKFCYPNGHFGKNETVAHFLTKCATNFFFNFYYSIVSLCMINNFPGEPRNKIVDDYIPGKSPVISFRLQGVHNFDIPT